MAFAKAANGPNFTDPREFYRAAYLAAKLTAGDAGAGTQSTSATAGFFTNIALGGVADDTNWTADTYKTILSISSGVGIVSNLVGPTGLAGTPTTTFEITVDGALTTVAVTATTTGHRAMLGPFAPSNAMFTSASNFIINADSIDAGKTTQTVTSAAGVVPTWNLIRLFGTPCLMFRNSLLIRMKSSESNSTTTNVERRSAVQYMVMG